MPAKAATPAPVREHKPPIAIDRSVGAQEFLDISYRDLTKGHWEYHIVVRGPKALRPGYHQLTSTTASADERAAAIVALLEDVAGGVEVLYDLTSRNVHDRVSLAILVSSAMAQDPHFCFGRDQLPYRWVSGTWESAEKWLLSLDYSMHSLVRTSVSEGSGTSLSAEAWSAFRAKSQYPAEGADLTAFGNVPGVAVLNGVLQLQDDGTVVCLPHDPRYLNRHLIVCYDDKAIEGRETIQRDLERDAPETKLGRFLKSTLTKPGHLDTLRRWFGYHLVLNWVPNAEKMVYIWGPGGNGKSQLTWLLRGLLGEEAHANLRLSDLRSPSALELLVGKVAMIGSEASASTDIETLKALVSREPLTCNPKYRKPFTVFPECLVTQCSNHPPEFSEQSGALSRRIVVLHLENVFTQGENQVQDLAKQILKDEFDLLVGWALQGAFEVLQDERFRADAGVLDDSRTVVELGNPIEEFQQLLEFGPYEVAASELYRVFERWCKGNGRRNTSSARNFLTELQRQTKAKKRYIEVREKATLYTPQKWLDEDGTWQLVDPKLPQLTRYTVLLGVRVADDGPFGNAIGTALHPDRKHVEMLTS